jgi:ATP-dependent RNA helicase DeaD
MSQEQRSRTIGRLKAGTTELVVATDVAARGLDVDGLTHVVNYDVPASPEAYVHRIGRVGRAGRAGTAITLAQPREQRMLKAIERITRRPIAVDRVPTVADVRARRLDATRDALAGALDGGAEALDRYRVVVESLAEEHGLMEVALAAVRLAHEASGHAADEEEIPDLSAPAPRAARPARSAQAPHQQRGPAEGMTRLFVGAGRERGIRPQDLVGAIANEAGLNGRQIGAIEIADRFSLVEVPEAAADHVVAALRGRSIKGKKTTVRRERFGGPGGRRRHPGVA